MPRQQKTTKKQTKRTNRRTGYRAVVLSPALKKDRASTLVGCLRATIKLAEHYKLDRDFNGSDFVSELKYNANRLAKEFLSGR